MSSGFWDPVSEPMNERAMCDAHVLRRPVDLCAHTTADISNEEKGGSG